MSIVYGWSCVEFSDTYIYAKENLAKVDDIIRFSDVYTKYWNSEADLDLKRRKEAELLVRDELPPGYIKGFIVYDTESKQKLIEFGVEPNEIIIKKEYYF